MGTPSGLKAQEAQAELTRRLIVEVRIQIQETKKSNLATEEYNKVSVGIKQGNAFMAQNAGGETKPIAITFALVAKEIGGITVK